MAAPTPDLSGFRNPSAADSGALAAFLSNWAALPEAAERYRLKYELLNVKSGETVLDLGCGAGDDLVRFGQFAGASGRVVGVDINEAMIATARERVAELGMPQVETRHIEPGPLPFADMSFDAVHTERVLMHVPDIDPTIREIVRVLRPGGRVVACELDRASVVWDLPDLDLQARLSHVQGGPNPLMGRQLVRRFRQAGLTNLEAHGSWLVAAGERDIEGNEVLIEQRLRVGVANGDLSETDVSRYREYRAAALEAGEYFHATPFFIVRGYRPATSA